jgi:hypothetical protein
VPTAALASHIPRHSPATRFIKDLALGSAAFV